MKTLHSIVLRLLAVLCLLAPGPLLSADQPAVGSKHCLWKLQGPRNTVFLLGSVHFLKKEHYPLPPPIESAFSNALIVAFEADLDELESVETQAKFLTAGRLPEGQTLKSQLTPATYASLRGHLQDSILPVSALEGFKPWFATITVVALELQRQGFDPEFGVDKHFYRLARQAKKQTVGLESTEDQIRLLTDLSEEDGDALVKETLQEIDTARKMLTDLTQAWTRGDAARLDALLNEGFKDHPRLRQRMLTDRNRRWMPQIEAFAAGGTNAIVIVGTGHLVGPDSVVDLLRKQGHRLTQE
jgi:uncharacterized protein